MNSITRPPATRRQHVSWLLASAGFCAACTTSIAQVVLDFEGVPAAFNYDGPGFNLDGYYAGETGGPTFGPQATILEVGGSLNPVLYPPSSGIGVLWGEGLDLELAFTTGLAQNVSLSYRSIADVFVFAYDPSDVLLGFTSGPASLGTDPEGFLAVSAAGFDIARVLIAGPPGAFLVDDVTYAAVPEPGHVALLASLGLAAFAGWRRRS